MIYIFEYTSFYTCWIMLEYVTITLMFEYMGSFTVRAIYFLIDEVMNACSIVLFQTLCFYGAVSHELGPPTWFTA